MGMTNRAFQVLKDLPDLKSVLVDMYSTRHNSFSFNLANQPFQARCDKYITSLLGKKRGEKMLFEVVQVIGSGE